MSETSAKSSSKKGFKAPVLKVSVDENKVKQVEGTFPGKKEKKTDMKQGKRDESSRTSPKNMKKLKKKFEKSGEDETENVKKMRKPEISLTDSQYEEIFKAVLTGPKSQHNIPIEELMGAGMESMSEKPSVKGSHKKPHTGSDESVKTSVPLKERNLTSQLNPLGSHIRKQNSQASSVLKPEISLTDSQYEDIFKAVLTGPKSQHNTPIKELMNAGVASSSEKSSVKGSHKKPLTESEESVKTLVSLKERNLSSELSPWGSHISKQNSQASSILKELQQSQASSSLLSPEPSSSSEDTDADVDADADVVADAETERSVQQPSQRSSPAPRPPTRVRKVNKRPVLEELQAKRNVGLWVFCDRMTCQKQRYLPDVTDPQELPDIWYCHMNPDPNYNSCSCEEQQPSPEEEEDMIDNEFTCGSVVWAHVPGFPWWPAMVDDDPDLECYYWLEEDFRTVTFYHVVFFDKSEVTRAWIPLNKIMPFKKMNTFKQRVVRGIDFTPRLQVAREQAVEAASMTVVQRLKKYSFIARYKGPIYDDQTQIEKTKKQYKLKCQIGKKEAGRRGRKRRAETNKENITPFEAVVKTNLGKKQQKQRKVSVNEIENKSVISNNNKDSDTYISISEVAEKQLDKDSESTFIDSASDKTNHKPSSDVENQDKTLNPEVNEVADGKRTQKDLYPETIDGLEIKKCDRENAKTLVEKTESETPSVIGDNESNKSKTSSKSVRNPETSMGGVVEPTEDQDSQSNKISQSTIADFLAGGSEDAVVPERDFSQQSEPFEE